MCMYNVGDIFVQGTCANNVNVFMSVLEITLLIALSSYEEHILTWLSDTCKQDNWHIWHSSGIFVSATCMVKKGAVCYAFWLECPVMWGLHVDHCSSAVEHVCDVGDIFVQGYMSIIWKNVCQYSWPDSCYYHFLHQCYVPFTILLASCVADTKVSHDQKVVLHLISIVLT